MAVTEKKKCWEEAMWQWFVCFSALQSEFISALLALDREAKQVWIAMSF